MNETREKGYGKKIICSTCQKEIKNPSQMQLSLNTPHQCDNCALAREIDEMVIMISDTKEKIIIEKQKIRIATSSIKKERSMLKRYRQKLVELIAIKKSKMN